MVDTTTSPVLYYGNKHMEGLADRQFRRTINKNEVLHPPHTKVDAETL